MTRGSGWGAGARSSRLITSARLDRCEANVHWLARAHVCGVGSPTAKYLTRRQLSWDAVAVRTGAVGVGECHRSDRSPCIVQEFPGPGGTIYLALAEVDAISE